MEEKVVAELQSHVSTARYFAEFLFKKKKKKILEISKRFSYRKWFTFSAKVLCILHCVSTIELEIHC